MPPSSNTSLAEGHTSTGAQSVRVLLAPGIAICFGLTSLGLPLAVLPYQVTFTLGFGPLIAGLVMATEAVTTLGLRAWMGRLADRRGARYATQIGLAAAAGSGLLYLLSASQSNTTGALILLFLGRITMGVGQGLLFTGGTAWAVGLFDSDRTGKAISWIGIAMFSGVALGTVLGGASPNLAQALATAIDVHLSGFTLAAWFTLIAPLVGWIATLCAPATPRTHQPATPASSLKVLAAIWRPSVGFAAASVGYSTVTSFVVIAFSNQGWSGGGVALSAFVACFVVARVFLGDVADRARGAGAISIALSVQATGLFLMWFAGSGWTAILGAAISGMGSSVTYPLLALPAIRAVPSSQTALAIGLYDGSFDIATFLTPPICGAVATKYGYSAIFLMAGMSVLLGILPARAAWAKRNLGQVF